MGDDQRNHYPPDARPAAWEEASESAPTAGVLSAIMMILHGRPGGDQRHWRSMAELN